MIAQPFRHLMLFIIASSCIVSPCRVESKNANKQNNTQEDAESIYNIEYKSYTKGPQNAPVLIYQYLDFEDPFCARASQVVKKVTDSYGDKVRVIHKSYPLPYHPHAIIASEAALAACAQDSNKFWEMHDILFNNYHNLEFKDLIRYAKQIGLDINKFTYQLDNHIYKAQVIKEMEDGKEKGVVGPTTFIINGKCVTGSPSYDSFKMEIDAALKNRTSDFNTQKVTCNNSTQNATNNNTPNAIIAGICNPVQLNACNRECIKISNACNGKCININSCLTECGDKYAQCR